MQIPLHSIREKKLFVKWRDIIITPDSIEQAHRHDYYQLMLLEQVKGYHNIDFEKYKATDRSLHFVGKGRVHEVDFNQEVVGGVLLFPEAVFGGSENDLQLLHSFSYFKSEALPILNLSKIDFESILNLTNRLRESIDAAHYEMSKYLLFALLIQVRDIYNKYVGHLTSQKEPKELIEFNRLLKEQCKVWNSIEDYLNQIGITASRLNHLCKKQYGKTALQVLHDRKLLEAKRMLAYTEKQVKEIAYECGFEDVAYFNRFFKKHTDCTPLVFRRNH